MTAIAGTRRSMKELADGTIRVQIDIDPIHRAAFFEAFSQIDMPVALAPLVAGFEQEKPTVKQSLTVEKLKGGELAKWAGIFCNDREFEQWLSNEYPREYADCLQDCATWIREKCNVDSRAELDHNPEAGLIFREQIMAPFADWKESHK